MPDSPTCPHIDAASDLPRSYTGCEECLKTGDTWVNLRLRAAE